MERNSIPSNGRKQDPFQQERSKLDTDIFSSGPMRFRGLEVMSVLVPFDKIDFFFLRAGYLEGSFQLSFPL
jgi:hypothetical protein